MSVFQIPELTRRRQDLASRPKASAWVSANAGSGKTFVLSRRVVRLLLDGTDPARILCLTFTKAAAAEMATRVFKILGDWVRLEDATLSAELEAIDGKAPAPARLALARRLFAHALETPGGLKIQTIHGFCEALLHQFPLEANVAGHFTVLDERIAAELMADARAHVLHAAETSPESDFGRALATVIELMSDAGAQKALDELIQNRDAFRRWIVDEGELELALTRLRGDLDIEPGSSLQSLDERFRSETTLDLEMCKAVAAALKDGTKTDQARGDQLTQAWTLSNATAFREFWLSIFLTGKLEPRKSLATKKITEGHADLVDLLIAEQQRLLMLLELRRAMVTVQGTTALLRLADAVIGHYERAKMAKGFLDFEDLVVRTANLLSRSDAALWVQYKLDQGLDHILVDEAQDTSPRQWEVVQSLAGEFFAGEGAHERVRTIFAVGDEKQSIYSFQGAVPAYFDEMRRDFAKRSEEAAHPFHSVDLQLSFRSTPDVLGAVDQVFRDVDAHKGLSRDLKAPVHEAIRKDPGIVDIWPMETPEDRVESEDWRIPIDHVGSGNPMLKVARRIAQTIRGWMSDGIANPGDIMILVRKRGPFVEALNRELKQLDVPAAGSDRLVLTDHIAVKDLAALGRFLLLPEDDLSLASVLKSPLFDLTDDDLLEVAREIPEKSRPGTLWQMLARRAETDPKWEIARKQLEIWRARADFMPPYEFFARLLAADNGRLCFRARLGVEVDDVLDEFLALTMAYEQAGTPGLEGFIAWMAAAPTEIKRELTNSKGMVRIMTVHGSKGLEAKIVFLVDPGGAPVSAIHDPAFLKRTRHNNPLLPPALVWLPPKTERMSWHDDAIDTMREGQEEEYRRLLYVALTRAEDRLVVCGWEPKRGAHERCWHNLVRRGLRPDAVELPGKVGNLVTWRWQKTKTDHAAQGTLGEASSRAAESKGTPQALHTPAWLTQKIPAFRRKLRFQPSRVFEAMEEKEGVDPVPGASRLEARRQPAAWPLERGRLIHRLLETLPDIDAAEQLAAAERYLDASLTAEFAGYRKQLLTEVRRIVNAPEFSPVFKGAARTEVPVVGNLTTSDGKEVSVSGQIDRLVVTQERILIVDYKTNLHPPMTSEGISREYLAQLCVYQKLIQQIYSDRTVDAALLWTSSPSLMEVPTTLLDETFSRLRSDGAPS